MTPTRIALILSTLTLAAPMLQPQQPSATAATPPPSALTTLTTTVRQVVLDVVVADKKGQPVQGLKQSDFFISEDGVPQTVVSFTERDAATEATPATPTPQLPPNTFANHAPVTNAAAMTVIVFDTNNIDWESGYYARYEVGEYLKSVTPGTPLCIFKLDPHGLQLIQDFTTDSQVLKKAVESRRNAQWPQLSPSFTSYPYRTLALRQLASYLSSFPGRKNLIWFGGNSPLLPGRGLLPDVDSFSTALQGAADTLTLNRVALYTVDPRGVVMNAFEGANIMMDASDLSKAVEPTGGKVFYNNNGLKQIVAQVVAAGSHYYTLAYTSTNNHWDGKFRKIDVQLANQDLALLTSQASSAQLKAPLHLEYRSGYYARPTPQPRVNLPANAGSTRKLISYSPKGDPALRTAPQQSTPLGLAMDFGAVAPFQILFRAQVNPAPAADKIKRHAPQPKDNFLEPQWLHKPYREVQIHYSVDPRDIEFTQPSVYAYHADIEFLAVVYDDTGAQVNSIVGTVSVDLSPDGYMRATRTTFGRDQTIAVPVHGTFYLRLGVLDLNSGRVGALEIPAGSLKPLPAETAASAPKLAP